MHPHFPIRQASDQEYVCTTDYDGEPSARLQVSGSTHMCVLIGDKANIADS